MLFLGFVEIVIRMESLDISFLLVKIVYTETEMVPLAFCLYGALSYHNVAVIVCEKSVKAGKKNQGNVYLKEMYWTFK